MSFSREIRVCYNTTVFDQVCIKVGELELFGAAPVTYGPGTRETPLAWWKVT
jgi:hypothetical protein